MAELKSFMSQSLGPMQLALEELGRKSTDMTADMAGLREEMAARGGQPAQPSMQPGHGGGGLAGEQRWTERILSQSFGSLYG